jgi:hypothetical protein
MTMADGPDREYAMNSSIQTVLAEWNKVCAIIWIVRKSHSTAIQVIAADVKLEHIEGH